jgi:hypothetical protein
MSRPAHAGLTGPALAALVERRIEEAIARGELDDLPGAGRPLEVDDIDPLVPAELRVALRVLKNAGVPPAELAPVVEINQLLVRIERAAPDDPQHAAGARRLRALLVQLEACGRTATAQGAWQQYSEALTRRLSR